MSTAGKLSVGEKYTRDQVQELLSVPDSQRGGSWDTGYTIFKDQLYVFCNVGSQGRTGHDYPNKWDGNEFIWSAKTGTTVSQPLMRRLLSGSLPAHIFFRLADRAPFEYAGIGKIVSHTESTPVIFRLSFVNAPLHRRVLNSDEICVLLEEIGFKLGPVQAKTREATRSPITVYVKLKSSAYRLVIDPAYEDRITALKNLPGVIKTPDFYYHNSNLRRFPQRVHFGKRPTHFGFAFDFTSSDALHTFIEKLASEPIHIANSNTTEVDPKTESETKRAARLGQQKFRSDLLAYWGGMCALTGFEMPELLRASHIKPWCDSAPKERLDPNNGLLLVVHIDGLFDLGLISFDSSGKMLCSPRVAEHHLAALGITQGLKISRLSEAHHKYLVYHRTLHHFE